MSARRIRPRKIFSILMKSFPEEEVNNLIDYIAGILRTRFGLDEYESYFLAEKYENSLRSYIEEHIDDCKIRNVVPKFVFSEFDKSRLVGRCFIYKTDTEVTKRYKTKLRLLNEIRNHIENLLWDDFELFCRKIVSLEPGYCNVRRRHRNGGIDFQGRYEVSPTMRVSFAGQAKHYGRNRNIGPNLIRELAGSMSDGRWAFGIIITTASFSLGARKLAREKRIECIDGEQIAFKIIEKGLGVIENNGIFFDESVFRKWLNS